MHRVCSFLTNYSPLLIIGALTALVWAKMGALFSFIAAATSIAAGRITCVQKPDA